MCLGEVGRVQDVTDRDSLSIALDGRTASASAMLLDVAPAVGEWVLVHSGFVIGKLTEAEARAALDVRRAAREEAV
ncbi:MAG TPA: HypC/HybG/HupF family hydrogenase formation chaperone [Jatrophihabitans sp.]|jgi:hydrogenase assembly chaperone HypC/HupF|nr:HypC/HybG/HupF family hydrogenase formation chaperone [Jatrophihabitans sp.]